MAETELSFGDLIILATSREPSHDPKIDRRINISHGTCGAFSSTGYTDRRACLCVKVSYKTIDAVYVPFYHNAEDKGTYSSDASFIDVTTQTK